MGKLLRLDDVDELNDILERDQRGMPGYKRVSVPELDKRETGNTHLLTTHRRLTESVLFAHSESLRLAAERHQSYTLCQYAKQLSLDHKVSRDDQKKIEMPHEYLRAHSLRVLDIP